MLGLQYFVPTSSPCLFRRPGYQRLELDSGAIDGMNLASSTGMQSKYEVAMGETEATEDARAPAATIRGQVANRMIAWIEL